ncbi:MAG: hypothetical protein PVF29_00380 [Desulfobacterales bacterium]
MDEWGQDPGVRAMRSVFSGMEAALQQILHELAISPYDRRIRGWLDTALPKFERVWHLARQMGVNMNKNEATVAYAHCLTRVIAAAGINIPDGMLPAEEKIEQLVSEVFS